MTEEYNSEHSTASVETQLVGSESRMIARSNNANKPLKQCAAFLSQYIKEHTLEDNEELIQAGICRLEGIAALRAAISELIKKYAGVPCCLQKKPHRLRFDRASIKPGGDEPMKKRCCPLGRVKIERRSEMLTVFDELVEASKRHQPFKIDLKKGVLKINDQTVIENWKPKTDRVLLNQKNYDPWEQLICNRNDYFKSVKTWQDKCTRSSLDQPVDVEELTNHDLIYGLSRDEAVARYDGYFMLGVVSGILKWPDGFKRWFMRMDLDNPNGELILLQKWFQPIM